MLSVCVFCKRGERIARERHENLPGCNLPAQCIYIYLIITQWAHFIIIGSFYERLWTRRRNYAALKGIKFYMCVCRMHSAFCAARQLKRMECDLMWFFKLLPLAFLQRRIKKARLAYNFVWIECAVAENLFWHIHTRSYIM